MKETKNALPTCDKDCGQLSSGGLTCLWLRRQNFCGWAEGWTWESPRFSVWSYIRRRQQCRRARHPARSLLLSFSLIPFAIVLGHFPPEIARSNVGRRRCNRRPRSCWERPRRQSRAIRNGKNIMAFDQVWRNATLKKGLRDPGTQFEGGRGRRARTTNPTYGRLLLPGPTSRSQ